MPRVHLFACALAGVIGAQIGFAQPVSAIECPEPEAAGSPGVIPEPAQEIAELSALLRSGDLGNRLDVIARDLQQKYPKADDTELTNFMMTAYCPVIAADEDLSESEEREHLEGFSSQVWQILSDRGP